MPDKKDKRSKSSQELSSLDFHQFSLLDQGFGLGDMKDYVKVQKQKSLKRDQDLFESLRAETLKESSQPTLAKKSFPPDPLREQRKESFDLKDKVSEKFPLKSGVVPRSSVKVSSQVPPNLPKQNLKRAQAKLELYGPVYLKEKPSLKKKEPRFPRNSEQKPFSLPLDPPESVRVQAKKIASKKASWFWLQHGLDLILVVILMGLQLLFLKLFFKSEDYFIIDLLLGHFTSSSFNWFNLLEFLALLYVCYSLYYFLFLFFVGKSLGSSFLEFIQKNTQESKKAKKVP